MANVGAAIEHIFPLVSNYKMEEKAAPPDEIQRPQLHLMPSKRNIKPKRRKPVRTVYNDYDSEDDYDTSEDEEFDSDESQD